MAFFKRELGPIERFENALKEKLAARQKLADRLSFTEAELSEKRTAAEQLAVFFELVFEEFPAQGLARNVATWFSNARKPGATP